MRCLLQLVTRHRAGLRHGKVTVVPVSEIHDDPGTEGKSRDLLTNEQGHSFRAVSYRAVFHGADVRSGCQHAAIWYAAISSGWRIAGTIADVRRQLVTSADPVAMAGSIFPKKSLFDH